MIKASESPVIIATITSYGKDDYSLEYLELTEKANESIQEISDKHCTASSRGPAESILADVKQLIKVPSPHGDVKDFVQRLALTLLDEIEGCGLGVMTENGISNDENGGSFDIETENGFYTISVSAKDEQ